MSEVISIYYKPDWSSLSVAELLEKAQEFAKKAYGNSLVQLLKAIRCEKWYCHSAVMLVKSTQVMLERFGQIGPRCRNHIANS